MNVNVAYLVWKCWCVSIPWAHEFLDLLGLRSASLLLHDYKSKVFILWHIHNNYQQPITGWMTLLLHRPGFISFRGWCLRITHPPRNIRLSVQGESRLDNVVVWLVPVLKLGYSAHFCNGHICFVSGIFSVLNTCMCVGEQTQTGGQWLTQSATVNLGFLWSHTNKPHAK